MVRILALETTETIGSVAAAIDDKLLHELQLDSSGRSAASLAPAIKTVLQCALWRPGAVQLVAVTIGPGSFTGLRVGLATAKTFAYAVGAEILGVDTLEVIAAAAPAAVRSVSVAVDAQRGDAIVRTFRRAAGQWLEAVGPAALVPLEAWLAQLEPGSIVSGPALARRPAALPPGITALAPECWRPTAGKVYCRPSAAEEKWARRGEKK
ncbi:MAG: tRNA (adenosine(37)-N6)-threonylcarbamoyltransferase complex dimerization subunit type 1 TsaB [Thermoguttaceae bacterium]